MEPDLRQNHLNLALGHNAEYSFGPFFPPIHLHPVDEWNNGVCCTGAPTSAPLITGPMTTPTDIPNSLSDHSKFHTPERHDYNQRKDYLPEISFEPHSSRYESEANNDNINSDCVSSSLSPSGQSKYIGKSTCSPSPDCDKQDENRKKQKTGMDFKIGTPTQFVV
ncbi:hypothetical protein CHS0354_008126 [Potamilus streckersoni]|uniref:Uncharacterized protein n=1 Tax=Potamilus streckersoni TaxID=2493646 RepID=A0AAE0SZU1_9BIVA|nr:hypothetical protein CHS0354_008126 [Potamilus streckersoni]